MSKIYYLCPDHAAPSGGVHTLYRHVGILRRAGFDAFVLHTQMFFRANWFMGKDIEIHYIADKQGPEAGDHLVIPEGMPSAMKEYAGTAVKRTVFTQNWAYTFDALGLGENWRQWGIRHVMTVSRYLRDLVKETMQLDAEIIHPGIPLPELGDVPRKRQIAYMPRKNPHDAARIQKIFAALDTANVGVPFVAVDGLRHEAVYQRLQESAIFLVTGYPEGCPLPPLEAMACGCVVLGFDGMGMREYVEQGVNGYAVADGDAVTAAKLLHQCLRAWDQGKARDLIDKARATAARFSLAHEEQVVADYWHRRFQDETS